MWGPLVLAGDLGPEGGRRRRTEQAQAPALVAAEQPLESWLKPVADKPGVFRTAGVARVTDDKPSPDVDLVPFYRLHERTYAVYWDLYTPDEWKQKAAEIVAEQERMRKLRAATVAFAQPGEMQPERDFKQQGENSYPDRILGRAGRHARSAGWFSFDLPIDPTHPVALVITYFTPVRRPPNFDILVDGKHVGGPAPPPAGAPRFYDAEYPVPADLVNGKQKVTVRFQAAPGSETAVVFGIRTIRADAPR